MAGGEPVTRDELFKLASESGMLLKRRFVEGNEKFTGDCLERFAALVAAAEREACADVCEDLGYKYHNCDVWDCADAIRARGEKP
jgi:hypothetical protein